MRLYLSGPMRGYKLFNIGGFARAARYLRDAGHEVFSPAEMDLADGMDPTKSKDWSGLKVDDPKWDCPSGDGLGVKDVMRRDIEVILKCDVIVMLPGWKDSKGATFEMAVAWYCGLDVWEMRENGDLIALTPDEPKVSWPVITRLKK